MPDRKASRVLLYEAVDPYDESDWPDQFAWLKDTLEKFDRAFRPQFSNKALAGATLSPVGSSAAGAGAVETVPQARRIAPRLGKLITTCLCFCPPCYCVKVG